MPCLIQYIFTSSALANLLCLKPFGWFYTSYLFYVQFGQVGVGDNVDHCSPGQVKFPHEQARSYYYSSQIWLREAMALIFPPCGPFVNYYSIFFSFTFQLCVHILFGTWQKVIQISCGWRHTLAVSERQNVFSWGRGTNGQLGHGETVDW